MPDTIRDRAFQQDRERTTEQQGPHNRFRQATIRERDPQPTRFTEATRRPEGDERPSVAGQLAEGRRQNIGEFQKGIENTTRMLLQSGSATAALVAGTLGFEDTAQRIQRRSEAKDEARGPMHEPRMADIRDVRSAGDFGDYMAHLAGSQAPIIGSIIGTAGVGGKVAVAGRVGRQLKAARTAALTRGIRANTQAGQQAGLQAAQAISRKLDIRGQAGSAIGSIAAITGVVAPGQAELLTDEDATGSVQARAAGGLASSVAGGVVGVLPVHRFLRSAGFNRRVAHDTARIKKAMGEQVAQRGLAASIAREAPLQAGLGGVVEFGQEMSIRTAHAYFKENVGMFDEEAVGMYINASVASTIISGFLGSLGPTIQHATQRTLQGTDNISRFSDEMAERVDAAVKQRMRAAILGNPTKTAEFRKIRAIDEELAQEGVSERLREELALVVGPEYVDTIIEGARARNMSVEDFLQENLADPETRDQPEFTIVASKITQPDPQQRMEAGLVNLVGQDILEFAPRQLIEALDQMSEGHRHDTITVIGELAMAVKNIREDEASITGDDVTNLRVQLGNMVGDANVEAAIEVALRRELQHLEFMARFDDEAGLETRGEGSDQIARMMDEILSAEELAERAGLSEATPPPTITPMGQKPRLDSRARTPLPALTVMEGVIPYQRTAAEGQALPEVSPGATRAAEQATQNTGLEHTVSRVGDMMREQGADDTTLIAEANRVIAEAKEQGKPKWLQGKRAKRTVNGALEVLNRLEVVRMTDEAAVLDQQIAAEGGFSAAQLQSMIVDTDASGLPREDQVLMRNPEGNVVAVDLVTTNRLASRNRRGRPAEETQLDSALAALGLLMERGYRALNKQEMEQQVKAAQERAARIPNTATKAQITQRIEDFRERRSPELINEFSVVNRRSAKKGMTVEEAFSAEFHAQHGLDAPIGQQRIDAEFILEIADELSTVGERATRTDSPLAAAVSPEVVGPQLLSQALDLVAGGDLESGQAVLRSMGNAERTAAETAYNQIRRSMSDTVDQAAVRAGEIMFGKETAQLRRDAARSKLLKDQARMRKRAREAPVKEALKQIRASINTLPRNQMHRLNAMRKAEEFFDRLLDGDVRGVNKELADFNQAQDKRPRTYWFGKRVMREMYLARMQVRSADHRAALRQKLDPTTRKMETEAAEAANLAVRVMQHKLSLKGDVPQKLKNRALFGERLALDRLIDGLDRAGEDLANRQFLAENVPQDTVEFTRSPSVQANLTLFDYVLYEQSQERGDGLGPERVEGGTADINTAELSALMQMREAHERMRRDFALLQVHEIMTDQEGAFRKALLKMAKQPDWYNSLDPEVAVKAVIKEMKLPKDFPVPRALISAFAQAARQARYSAGIDPRYGRTQASPSKIVNQLFREYEALVTAEEVLEAFNDSYREQFLRDNDSEFVSVNSAVKDWVKHTEGNTALSRLQVGLTSKSWSMFHDLQARVIRATEAQKRGKDKAFNDAIAAQVRDALSTLRQAKVVRAGGTEAMIFNQLQREVVRLRQGKLAPITMFGDLSIGKKAIASIMFKSRERSRPLDETLPAQLLQSSLLTQDLNNLANEVLKPYRQKVRVISSADDIQQLLAKDLIESGVAAHIVNSIQEAGPFYMGMIVTHGRRKSEHIAAGVYPGAVRLKTGELIMYISPLLGKSGAVQTLLHETGHLIEMEIFSRADEATQNAVFKEYAEWLRNMGKVAEAEATLSAMQTNKRGLLLAVTRGAFHKYGSPDAISSPHTRLGDFEYALGFREYFADRFANYATSNKKALNLVDRFFDRLTKVWAALKSVFKASDPRFANTPILDQWFDDMMFNMTPFERLKLMNEPRRKQWWDYTTEGGDLQTIGTITEEVLNVIPGLGKKHITYSERFKTVASSMSHTLEPGSANQNYGLRHMIEVQLTADERRVLARVFNQNRIRQQILGFIADDPAWVFEVEKHQDALIATGFQLWEAGALDIGPRAAGVFGKLDRFMSEQVFGEVLKHEQAGELLNAMQDGRIRQRESVFTDPMLVKKDSHLQKGLYGLTHAEMRYLEEFGDVSKMNPEVVSGLLAESHRFKGWDADQRLLLAKDLVDGGVFTSKFFEQFTDMPTWALEGSFRLQRLLHDRTSGNIARGLRDYSALLGNRLGRLFFGQMMRTRHSGNQGLIDAMNTIYHDVAGSRAAPSYDQTKTMAVAKYMSQYESILAPLTEAQKKEMRTAIFEGKPITKADGYSGEVVLATKKYQKLMQDMRNHAVSAGLQMGDLGAGANRIFAPWVFDEKTFRERGNEFLDFASQEKYKSGWLRLMREHNVMRTGKEGKDGQRAFSDADVAKFIKHYIDGLANQEGFADSEVIVDDTRQTQPHVRSMFKRELDFLWRAGDEGDRKKLAGFFDPNLNTTMAVYINQVMKRSTFNEFFGHGKQADFEANIVSQGGTVEDIQFFRDAIDMQMGTYGLELSPVLQNTIARVGKWFGQDWSNLDPETYRKVQGYVVTYQNIRLLAFAALTNVVDAAGIYVRSGELNMAFQGLKMGLAASRKNVTAADLVALKEQADMLGVSERIVVQDALGQLYGGVHFTGMAAKINDMFFRYNGMVALNRWMRLSALGTARIYLKKHAALAQSGNKKSKTALQDIGLRAEDLRFDDNGNILLLSDEQVLELGENMRPLEIQEQLLGQDELRGVKKEVWDRQQNFQEVLRDQRVKDALFRFVDEAVMRPSAMQRPSWGNDPNWGMFFHLKAFMYTYHERHLRRGLNKMLAEGDAGPLMMMGSFVGLMLAADLLRQFIQHGPEGDDRKKDWGFGDYVWDATHRSGVLGVGTVLPDMAKTMDLRSYQDPVTKYTSPAIEVGGPAVSQLDQLVRAGFGQRRRRAVIDAMPANNIWRALDNWGKEMGDTDPEEAVRRVYR